ncbi:uncharacterized protein SPSK_07709 [Sporothrix schenckii 1099-18]|uniref:Aminoglycoside phosphotransferase domain-containing protein n=1 Tax=Sporothrix schenckii 1099-18 TaxID=1397361 RepID=A0A0F2MK76_SPOSC|nr:uncharacterized protein SPSK_07709 [Sporothrix schenckii 1099-18]KJR88591.1 hypothetical protein SPSK_07709 [Sporothrix schenckii 1099-18]
MAAPQEQFAFPFVDNYNVPGSAFEQTGFDKLPKPDDVRLGLLQYRERRADAWQLSNGFLRPSVMMYRELGLAVKFGHHVSVSEAHALLFVRKHCPEVPMPEVYAWRRNRRQTFIYMQYIEGQKVQFEDLDDDQLRSFARALERVPQSLVSPIPFIGWYLMFTSPIMYGDALSLSITNKLGHVNGRPLRNWEFINSATPHAGPFPSLAAFHDWLTTDFGKSPSMSRGLCAPTARYDADTARRHIRTAENRAKLTNKVPIVLTHGRLGAANVLVRYPAHDGGSSSGPTPPRIVAVLDWSTAGWMPAHWEHCGEMCNDDKACILHEQFVNGPTKNGNGETAKVDGAVLDHVNSVVHFTLSASH